MLFWQSSPLKAGGNSLTIGKSAKSGGSGSCAKGSWQEIERRKATKEPETGIGD